MPTDVDHHTGQAGAERTAHQLHRVDRRRGHRALLRRRGITAVIAEPQDQKANRTRRGAKGGRPPAFDTQRYKNRNVVERSFNTFKQWRALATRYDKLALTYRGGVVLGAIITWLRELGDTP